MVFMKNKKEFLEKLREKVKRGAKCCTPHYYCASCPYRIYEDCYATMISNIVYLAENDPAFGRKVEKDES